MLRVSNGDIVVTPEAEVALIACVEEAAAEPKAMPA